MNQQVKMVKEDPEIKLPCRKCGALTSQLVRLDEQGRMNQAGSMQPLCKECSPEIIKVGRPK